MERIYNALLYEEKNNVGVSFPDFPGCVGVGKNIQDALNNAREALEYHIEGMLEDKEDIPIKSNDRKLKDYLSENPGGMASLVAVNIPESKAKRIDITLPEFLLSKIDRVAKKQHTNRSNFIMKSTLEYISNHQ